MKGPIQNMYLNLYLMIKMKTVNHTPGLIFCSGDPVVFQGII